MSSRRSAGIAGALLASIAVGAPAIAVAAPDERPNILVIQTDDQTLADLDVMPNVRSLITAQGVKFTSAVTPFAICCPSRAAMMTGAYPHNNGVSANFPPDGGFVPWEKQAKSSVGSWLKDAGYHTVHIGKYINGYGWFNKPAPTPTGWSEWYGTADPSTYQMYGYRVNHDGGQTRFGVFEVENPKKYQATVYTNIAQGVLRREAARPGPFYMQVAYLAPHVETIPLRKTINPRDVDMDDTSESSAIQSIPPRPHPIDRNKIPNLPLDTMASPSFNEADNSDKGTYVASLPKMTREDIQDLIEDNRQRKRSLMSVDRGIARLIATLKATGQLDNTVIMFMGDNGYMLGQHRIKKGKYFPYEPSLRIPLIVRGPGVTPGTVNKSLVSLIDVTPTVLDFAGVAPTGRAPDGVSLKPVLTGQSAAPARTMLLESGPQQAPNGDNLPLFDGVRTPHWSWWRYEDGSEELYDLVRDPFQINSRASDPAYRRTRAALIREWQRLKDCSGAECQVRTTRIPRPARG